MNKIRWRRGGRHYLLTHLMLGLLFLLGLSDYSLKVSLEVCSGEDLFLVEERNESVDDVRRPENKNLDLGSVVPHRLHLQFVELVNFA